MDVAALRARCLKCEPEFAVLLRDTYEAVIAGYHLNKRHWNTVRVDGTVPDDELNAWIEDSYDLVRRAAASAASSAGTLSPRHRTPNREVTR